MLLALSPWPATAQLTDTTPPTLTEFALDSTTVDVSGGPADLTVTMRLTDDLAGVGQDPSGFQNQWYLYAYSDDGQQDVYLTFGQFALVDGDTLDGQWQATVTIPQYSKSGPWRISTIQVSDLVGNSLWLTDTELAGMGYNPYFEVISPDEDTYPPEVLNIEFDPPQIDTSLGAQTVNLIATMRDDKSGVATAGPPNWDRGLFAYLTWENPGNAAVNRWSGTLSLIEDGGTPQEGRWQGSIFFPQHSQQGLWKLYIYGWDQAGNYFSMDWQALQDLDPPLASQIEVVSDPSDMMPPELKSFSLNPVTIDTSAANQVVSVSMEATDDHSGVGYGWAYFQSPSGQQYRWVYLPGWSAPDPLDVDLAADTTFPQFSEAGSWQVRWLYLYDRVENWRYWTQEEVEAMGLNTTLNVILPSLEVDGEVTDPAEGGTIEDDVFGPRAQVIVPGGLLSSPTTVAIDVLQDPLDVETPTGFAGTLTHYVNIHLEPAPDYPLAPPGLTVVLPLVNWTPPGTALNLFRIDPGTGQLVQAIDVYGQPVVGTVDPDGLSATFTGISRLSTVAALLPGAVVTWPTPATIGYGTPLSGAQQQASANMEGTYDYLPPAGTVLSAGTHTLSVTFTPTDTLYPPVTTTVDLQVDRAPLTITAENMTKPFGAPFPAWTVIYEGFVLDEDESVLDTPVTLSTTATPFSPPGDYPVTPGGATDGNYEITFVAGTLSITPPATITLLAAPGEVPRGSASAVLFQMYVPPSATLLLTSPNLQRLNAGVWSLVGRMYDDGTHGDLVAGDNTHSLAVTLNEAQAGVVRYRGSVAYKGQLRRTLANEVVVEVIDN